MTVTTAVNELNHLWLGDGDFWKIPLRFELAISIRSYGFASHLLKQKKSTPKGHVNNKKKKENQRVVFWENYTITFVRW